MSSDNLMENQAANKEGNHQGSGGGGGSSRKKPSTAARPTETQPIKCPRCDSPNTKFCYYNNYSLTQPRHFCKTCRRYWTKGGALRNIPVGGGCRKNKKTLNRSSSSTFSGDSKDSAAKNPSSYFFNSLSPAVDFQLGGLHNYLPRLFQNTASAAAASSSSSYNPHQLFSSFGDFSAPNSSFSLDPSGNSSSSLMGFNFNPMLSSSASVLKQDHGNINGAAALFTTGGIGDQNNNVGVNTNLATSIESLSSINQDLHWKLQQQRLAMLFGNKEMTSTAEISQFDDPGEQNQQAPRNPQPILFENLEISSKADDLHNSGINSRKDHNNGNLATEWFFDDNTYPPAVNSTQTNTSSSTDNTIQAWNSFNQYTALP